MKFLLSILLIALLSFVAGIYLPWYSIAVVGFVVAAIIPQKPLLSFVSGFLAVFLLWVVISASISSANEHVLAQKISMLLFKAANPTLLIIVTGLIGGIVAGLGALTGSFVRKK